MERVEFYYKLSAKELQDAVSEYINNVTGDRTEGYAVNLTIGETFIDDQQSIIVQFTTGEVE